MIFSGIQDFCKEIGESACYALCILHCADKYNSQHNQKSFDVIEKLYQNCSGTTIKDNIYYNKKNLSDNDNFFVQHPENIFYDCTGKKCSVMKTFDLKYKAKTNQYVIKYYERITTNGIVGHFEMDDFKPVQNSLTVKNGTLKSLRIITVL